MKSPQYESVLEHMGVFVSTLRAVKGVTDELATQFQQKQWFNISTDVTAKDLVDLALVRIENEPRELETLLQVLREIAGLDQIVKMIEKTYKEKLQANPEPPCNTSLGVTPKSTVDTTGAEFVGIPLNHTLSDDSSKLVADKLSGCTTDVCNQQCRASEPNSGDSHTGPETRNSLLPPNVEPHSNGYSSRAESLEPVSDHCSGTGEESRATPAKLDLCHPVQSGTGQSSKWLKDHFYHNDANTYRGPSRTPSTSTLSVTSSNHRYYNNPTSGSTAVLNNSELSSDDSERTGRSGSPPSETLTEASNHCKTTPHSAVLLETYHTLVMEATTAQISMN